MSESYYRGGDTYTKKRFFFALKKKILLLFVFLSHQMKSRRSEREIHQSITHKKVIERMQLISMVPLEINPKDASPPPKSALEQTFEFDDRSMSKFAKMLNYNIKGDISKMLNPEANPPTFDHQITSFTPAFEVPEPSQPEPASYHPVYDAVKPSPIQPTIGIIPEFRPKSEMTTASIVDNFNNSIRSFDPKLLSHAQDTCEPITPPEEALPKMLVTFDKQTTRQPLVKPIINKNDFYVPPPEKVVVTNFDKQMPRTKTIKYDEGRDYSDKAIPELDNLQKRASSNISMKKQLPRDYIAKRNERVAFLEDIARQQRALLTKISPQRKNTKSLPPKRETFALQRPRTDLLGVKPVHESKFPSDPIKSLQYIMPRIPAVKINDKERDTTSFWK